MYEATDIAKSSDKEKWVYSGYGIAIDGGGSRDFGNDFARNVVLLGVNFSTSWKSDLWY